MTNTIPKEIDDKIKWAIDFSWNICLNKIEDQEIKVNKEASLQLQYANILKQILDLIKFSPDERFEIELESSYFIDGKQIIADIVIEYKNKEITKRHAIELKFYKTFASSGGKRGAADIFMCSVYKDLYFSELYIENKNVDYVTCLILTDYSNFINPKNKNSKNWTYDISDDTLTQAKLYDTSIGGKEVNFELKNQYLFKWIKNGSYWSCTIRK